MNKTRTNFQISTRSRRTKKGIVNGSRVPSDASESARRIRKSSRGNYADCRLESICWWLERGILETTWVHPWRRTNYQSVLPVCYLHWRNVRLSELSISLSLSYAYIRNGIRESRRERSLIISVKLRSCEWYEVIWEEELN